MADQSVVSGGGGTSHDNLEPDLEIVDAAAIRTADAQSRRYAHTTRRGVNTPALGTRTTPIATPADGTLPEDRDAASVSAKLPRPTPRDSATAPPRFVADHRDSAPLAAPRFVADRRDSAPVAVPRTAADHGDSASIAVPRTGTDRRDGAPLAAPRFVADRKSAPIAVPRSIADRKSAPLAAPRLPPEPRDSNQVALPKLALDEQDSAGVTLPKLASEPDEPWFVADRASAPIAVPRQASDARDSAANGVPKSTRSTGAAAAETSNRSSAPSASTALYRRRNTRPTAVQAEADEPAPPSRGGASEISLEPRGPDLGPEDSPSCLPSVMLESPDGVSRLRSAVDLARDAVDTGLRSAVDIARMGVPRSPMRFIVPFAIAALVALAVWLLY